MILNEAALTDMYAFLDQLQCSCQCTGCLTTCARIKQANGVGDERRSCCGHHINDGLEDRGNAWCARQLFHGTDGGKASGHGLHLYTQLAIVMSEGLLHLLQFVSLLFTALVAYTCLGELLSQLLEGLSVATVLQLRLMHGLLGDGEFLFQALAVTGFAHAQLLSRFSQQAGDERVISRDEGTGDVTTKKWRELTDLCEHRGRTVAVLAIGGTWLRDRFVENSCPRRIIGGGERLHRRGQRSTHIGREKRLMFLAWR